VRPSLRPALDEERTLEMRPRINAAAGTCGDEKAAATLVTRLITRELLDDFDHLYSRKIAKRGKFSQHRRVETQTWNGCVPPQEREQIVHQG